MTKKQFNGIVDCLVDVCTFNTSRDYSLSLRRYESPDFFDGVITVFTNHTNGSFTMEDITQLLGIANAWNVSLYFETKHGVTVAKYL